MSTVLTSLSALQVSHPYIGRSLPASMQRCSKSVDHFPMCTVNRNVLVMSNEISAARQELKSIATNHC